MGGKSSKEVSKTEITNEINTQITNLTKNVTNILNETITNSTMNVVNQNAQSIEVSTGGGNTFAGGNLNVSGKGSVFRLNQQVNLEVTNKAVANMTQDATAMANLASQVNAGVMNKIQNDSAMQQAMQAASNLQKATSTAGGMNDMIGNVTKMIGDVLTPGTTMNKDTQTKITTKMMASLSNTTINENTIKAIVTNNVTNNISQLNSASCKISTNFDNKVTIGDINIDQGGVGEILQSVNAKALNECVLGAVQKTDLGTAITSGSAVSAGTDTSNKNALAQSQKTDTAISEKTETHDAFGQMISSFSPFAMMGSMGPMCGIVCLIVCILIVVMMVLPMMKPSE
jgi:intracellular sulfur oxidation DsrE/DsrF family protein